MVKPENTGSVLHYVHDPLCGWCYAASPLRAVRWHSHVVAGTADVDACGVGV